MSKKIARLKKKILRTNVVIFPNDQCPVLFSHCINNLQNVVSNNNKSEPTEKTKNHIVF